MKTREKEFGNFIIIQSQYLMLMEITLKLSAWYNLFIAIHIYNNPHGDSDQLIIDLLSFHFFVSLLMLGLS